MGLSRLPKHRPQRPKGGLIVVSRHRADGFMPIDDNGRWVTHSDYKAIEAELDKVSTEYRLLVDHYSRLTAELAECRNLITGLRHELARALK